MDKSLEKFLTDKLPGISWKSAEAVITLTAEGGTVPFIARYRKERTGNLDEVQVRDVIEARELFDEIVKRREFVITEIQTQGNMNDILLKRLQASWDLAEIEELYRPYKRKKKSKATLARDAGIEPLADWIWNLGQEGGDPGVTLEVKAKDFINPSLKFATYDEVLRGAHNILIERIANDMDLRTKVRESYFAKGELQSKPGKKVKAKSKYENYFDHKEPVSSLMEKKNSHRYLAMRRGWKEGELTVTVQSPEEETLLGDFETFSHPASDSIAKAWLRAAAKSALTVNVVPSIENEVHKKLKDNADVFAAEVFAENVKKLLLASPYGARCVLGIDPGLRTGCKVALIDNKGHFISHTVLKTQGTKALEAGIKLFKDVLKQIKIDAVAVGNGTGGREAEVFIRKVLKEIEQDIPVVLVNEAGASVYSASDVAREEFPDLDLTVRGAVSIARRLQDPLAELVKIDPKSIGVGQYQHDIGQTTLKKRLDHVVEFCVNHVGVDVNTASEHLLRYVAGIGPAIAKNIVQYRQEKGLFKRRDELSNVPQYSSKAFEQSAGFLRVIGGESKLDATGIHPERYSAVKDMAKEADLPIGDVIGQGAEKILAQREKWVKLIGEYTFDDIIQELKKPGRDPRDPYKVFQFRDDIFEVKDLKEGMICNGIVTNVTNFGAFVDIGVHQDGLVHISEIANRYVQDTQKVCSPGDQVQVKVLKVDTEKNQISLTMKMASDSAGARKSAKKRAPSGDNKGRGGKRPQSAARGKGGDSHRGGGQKGRQQQKPRRPAQPFNNPFGALMDLNKK